MGSSGHLGSLYAAEAIKCIQDLSAVIVCCDLTCRLGDDCGALRLIEGMDPIGTTIRQQALRAGYPLAIFMHFYLETIE